MTSALSTRVMARRSSVRTSRKMDITGTLFQRNEDSGETGEYLRILRSYESKALVDPFVNLYSVGGGSMAIISPDFNPFSLIKLPNESSALRQCIDAMVTNIDSFGYRMEYIGEQKQEDSPAAIREKERIESLMEKPNGEYTVTELRERLRRDIETFGYGFIECGRDDKKQIVFLNQVPAHTIRMTAKLN
jgi:capsid portal protein